MELLINPQKKLRLRCILLYLLRLKFWQVARFSGKILYGYNAGNIQGTYVEVLNRTGDSQLLRPGSDRVDKDRYQEQGSQRTILQYQ